MASVRKRGNFWFFRIVEADGIQRERKGCSDKRATGQMAAAAEVEAARVRSGLSDPRAEAYRRHDARPLADNIDDYRRSLADKGGTGKHVGLFVERARRVAALAAGARLPEIDPPKSAKRAARDGAAVRLGQTLEAARLADLTGDSVQ